jgi:hypothetical protein
VERGDDAFDLGVEAVAEPGHQDGHGEDDRGRDDRDQESTAAVLQIAHAHEPHGANV